MLPASAPIAAEQNKRRAATAEGCGDIVPGKQAAVSIACPVMSSDAHNQLSTCVTCVESFLLYLAVTEKPALLSRCLISEWLSDNLSPCGVCLGPGSFAHRKLLTPLSFPLVIVKPDKSLAADLLQLPTVREILSLENNPIQNAN